MHIYSVFPVLLRGGSLSRWLGRGYARWGGESAKEEERRARLLWLCCAGIGVESVVDTDSHTYASTECIEKQISQQRLNLSGS